MVAAPLILSPPLRTHPFSRPALIPSCLHTDAHDFSTTIDQGQEAKRFDPDGHYVRRWLPVLARLPVQYIHEPWRAPEAVLADAGGCGRGGAGRGGER